MDKQTCRHCACFVDDPAAIEREFPGLTILGSADASVRGAAGICRELDRFMDPISVAECPTFVPRYEATDDDMQTEVPARLDHAIADVHRLFRGEVQLVAEFADIGDAVALQACKTNVDLARGEGSPTRARPSKTERRLRLLRRCRSS